MTDQGAARAVIEGGRAVGAETATGQRFLADAVVLATGPAVPKMAAASGQTIGDGTPIALLVQTKPLAHPLRAVLNTPLVAVRPAPGGTFSIDADWAADEGVKPRADGGYDIDERVVAALLAEAAKVMEGNPKLEVATIGVGGKPIPGDGEPVVGALRAIPAITSPSVIVARRSVSSSEGVVTLSSVDRTTPAALFDHASAPVTAFPMRYCADAVNVTGQGGSFVMRGDEEISDRREDRNEPLQAAGRSEALHRAFSLSQRQMRVFRSIVETLVGPVLDSRHNFTLGRAIGTELVCDNPLGRHASFLQ